LALGALKEHAGKVTSAASNEAIKIELVCGRKDIISTLLDYGLSKKPIQR
jgi:hypothetical protein